MDDFRFPIGEFAPPQEITREYVRRWIQDIGQAPEHLTTAVNGLTTEQLDTPYRPGGWTVRQVVHHLPDSHLNAFVRCKLALTEDQPTIKPYHENLWAKLSDYRDTPIETSLNLLTSLHQRWIVLLESLWPDDLNRTFLHPDSGTVSLRYAIGLYAWHGKHHVAHITALRSRMTW